MSATFKVAIENFARRGASGVLTTQLLSVAAMLVIAAGVMFGINLIDLRHDFDANRASSRIVEQLDDVEKYLMGVDLTVRGYALSGNDVFLDYRRLEMHKLMNAYSGLPLVAAVPQHQQSLERLRKAMRVRLNTLAELMRIAYSDRAALGQAIIDPDVRSTMREARAAISSMRSMEIARRDTMATEALDRARRNTLLAGAILALSFAFALVGLSLSLFGGRDQ